MKEGVVARKFLRAFAEWDLDTYEHLLAPGAIEGRPQMGEQRGVGIVDAAKDRRALGKSGGLAAIFPPDRFII